MGAGLLTTLLFTLPPLLDIRGVRPILILRRAVEANDDPFAARLVRKLQSNLAQIGASDPDPCRAWCCWRPACRTRRAVAWSSAVALAVILLVLLGMSCADAVVAAKVFLRRTRLHLPSSLRHGLANLYRPGNPSAALLAALGLGVMQIMAVYFVQQTVVREMQISTAANLPNMFLIDIATHEVDGVRTLLTQQPSVQGTPEMIPVVSARLTAVNGTAAAAAIEDAEHVRRAGMMRDVNLTWPPTRMRRRRGTR